MGKGEKDEGEGERCRGGPPESLPWLGRGEGQGEREQGRRRESERVGS